MANTREKRCLCFYFIQGQQGESLDELNVFEVGAGFLFSIKNGVWGCWGIYMLFITDYITRTTYVFWSFILLAISISDWRVHHHPSLYLLHPQIPGVQKLSDACLRDVLTNFPLVTSMLSVCIDVNLPDSCRLTLTQKGNGGTYHFRFRIADPVAECGFVWMDLTDPSARLPM